MNQEQWYDAIKSNKKVKFTDEFLTLVTLNGMDKHLLLGSKMTTKEMHLTECKLAEVLSNECNRLEEIIQKEITIKETMKDDPSILKEVRAAVDISIKLSNSEKDKKLDLLRCIRWDERKFGNFEVVKE
tara:strand:- start:354 stop:740 length:387 start_codon:yes stop_codon:yes gene_type:complete